MYKHIKKEHLFIFLVLFTAIVLFTYFEEFNYTGLTARNTCTDKDYECCSEGEGTNYFSLDYSCPNNQQCWSSCSEKIKENNLITTSAVWDSSWNSIKNFFINLFKKDVVGITNNCCLCKDDDDYLIGFGETSSGPGCAAYCRDKGYTYDSFERNAHIEHSRSGIDGNDRCEANADEGSEDSTQCQQGEFPLLSYSEGHASLNIDTYQYKICNGGDDGLTKVGGTEEIISIAEDDTHVSTYIEGENAYTNRYGNNVLKLKPLQDEATLEISYEGDENTKGNCDNDYQCLFSISSLYNAHLGNCNEFNIKACYKITGAAEECTPNERACEGNNRYKICRDDGIYGPPIDCAEGKICENGGCKFPDEIGYTLIITKTPSNAGTVRISPDKTRYDVNEMVTLTAIPTPGSYTFLMWTGNILGSVNPREIEMNENMVITANFQQIQCNNDGIKEENEQCDGTQLGGETCVSQGFDSGTLSCNANCIFDTTNCINDPDTTYTLTITKIPPNAGTVSISPDKTRYDVNEMVTLTAIPTPGSYTFLMWTGNILGSVNPREIEMNENMVITANFKKIQDVRCQTSANCPDNGCYEPACTNNLCSQTPVANGQNDEICLAPMFCDGQGQCIPARENCNNPLGDNDKDGIKAAFDKDCNDNFIQIIEATPSNDEPYTNTKIQVDCEYNILESSEEGADEKQLGLTTEKFIGDCIEASISTENSIINCNEDKKTAKLTNNIVSFKECYVGETPGESSVLCKVKDTCSSNIQNQAENFVIINEYLYCPEISFGSIEFVENSIKLNRANEPGEELKITGRLIAAESGTITVNAALIDLQNDIILKEVSAEIEYTEENADDLDQEKFELLLEIPPVKTDTYFVYVKAYIDEDESCIQDYTILDIKSDLEDETSPEEECENEEVNVCLTELKGICKQGSQECVNGEWNECISTVQPTQDICNDGLDNNCDGFTDENCQAEPRNAADSDNDNLPDSWEMQNFETLLFNANDDPDGDGISNIDEYRSNTDPNIAEEKKANLTWLWIIIGIIVLGLIIFVLFKFLKKPRSKGGSGSYVDPRLKDYIEGSLKKGFTKHQIRQALLTKGWSQEDIDKAIK